MQNYLVFRLHGALASWGIDVGATPDRRSSDHPTKSAVCGLIAAALGIAEKDDEKHLELYNSYKFGVLVNTPGQLLSDFHTVARPSKDYLNKHKKPFATRRDELLIDRTEQRTALTRRQYYTDALYTIAICPISNDVQYTLEDIQAALLRPTFALYLGRKSCPPDIPIESHIVNCDSFLQAFKHPVFKNDIWLGKLIQKTSAVRVYWEGSDSDLKSKLIMEPTDRVTSRQRWTFGKRRENMTTITLGGDDNVSK
jgi:CRISPR system Cascade subunit CasD